MIELANAALHSPLRMLMRYPFSSIQDTIACAARPYKRTVYFAFISVFHTCAQRCMPHVYGVAHACLRVAGDWLLHSSCTRSEHSFHVPRAHVRNSSFRNSSRHFRLVVHSRKPGLANTLRAPVNWLMPIFRSNGALPETAACSRTIIKININHGQCELHPASKYGRTSDPISVHKIASVQLISHT